MRLFARGATGSAELRLGGSAIVDHALFAMAQLLLHILLARWLSQVDYGAFALAYSVWLIAVALHAALLSEPLLVLGRRDFADCLESYWGVVLCGHAALSLGLALLLGAIAFALLRAGLPALGFPMLAFGVVTPLLLLIILMRRLCYARLSPEVSASGGVVYTLVMIVSVSGLHGVGHLSVITAVGCIAAASFASAAWIGLRLGVVLRRPQQWQLVRRALATHWAYGRWAVWAALANWIPWNLHFVILSSARPLEEIAGMRALYNVLLPILHLMMAVSTMALPILAGHLESAQPRKASQTALRIGLFYGGAGLAYALAVLVLGERILLGVYGDAYRSLYPLAAHVAILQVPVGGIMVMALLQRAARRSDRALLMWLPYVSLSLLLGGLGGLKFGASGLVHGMLAAAVMALPLASLGLRHWAPWRSEEPFDPANAGALHTMKP